MPRTELSLRFWLFLSKVLTCTGLILLLYADFVWTPLMESSDFLLNIYPPAQLVLKNRSLDLYPALDAQSFLTSPLNSYAHQLLPHIGNSVAIYMYSPLVALLLSPLAALPVAVAMSCWQLFSLICLYFSVMFLSASKARSSWPYFWLALLFIPVWQTLLIGQLGLVLGLLPLCLGYFLLQRNSPLKAGLAWSLLILKPQFILTAVIVCLVFLALKQYRCLLGMTCGALILCLGNQLIFGFPVIYRWLHCLKLSDAIFSNPHYTFTAYQVICLPGSILMTLPMEWRNQAKVILYAAAALIALGAMYRLWMVAESEPNHERRIDLIFISACLLPPIIAPHFLYYDLCLELPCLILCLSDRIQIPGLRRLIIICWAAINSYRILVLFAPGWWTPSPLILALILCLIYLRVQAMIDQRSKVIETSLT